VDQKPPKDSDSDSDSDSNRIRNIIRDRDAIAAKITMEELDKYLTRGEKMRKLLRNIVSDAKLTTGIQDWLKIDAAWHEVDKAILGFNRMCCENEDYLETKKTDKIEDKEKIDIAWHKVNQIIIDFNEMCCKNLKDRIKQNPRRIDYDLCFYDPTSESGYECLPRNPNRYPPIHSQPSCSEPSPYDGSLEDWICEQWKKYNPFGIFKDLAFAIMYTLEITLSIIAMFIHFIVKR